MGKVAVKVLDDWLEKPPAEEVVPKPEVPVVAWEGTSFGGAADARTEAAVATTRFGFVPTSLLDFTNSDLWQLKSPRIRELMGRVGLKRGYQGTGTPDDLEGTRFIATAFNSGLTRFLVLYYTDPGARVLDPFAGWGTRAHVCQLLGRQYAGFDVAKDTVEAVNEAIKMARQNTLDGAPPGDAVVFCQDGIALEGVPAATYDALLTCPPYANREVYEDADPGSGGKQLSRLERVEFENLMARGFRRWYEVLKPGALAIVVAMDWREEGHAYPFIFNLTKWAMVAGFEPHDVAIHRLRGTIALGVGTFMPRKFLPKSHETVLVFRRP